MKALALHQPYAGFVAACKKPLETRWWKSDYRGDVLICSTKGDSHSYEDDVASAYAYGMFLPTDDVEKLLVPRGVMLCVATIVGCKLCDENDALHALAPVVFLADDGTVIRKCGFELDNIRLVKQKSVKCGRKWFTISDEEIEFV